MTMNPALLALPWFQTIMGTLFVLVCLLLILVVLLQKGRGGGLAGAFGGGGGSSAFGSKTGDVFTFITIVLAVLFLSLSVVNNYVFQELGMSTPADAAVESAAGDAAGVGATGTDPEAPAAPTTTAPG